jgi:hypothetical protein
MSKMTHAPAVLIYSVLATLLLLLSHAVTVVTGQATPRMSSRFAIHSSRADLSLSLRSDMYRIGARFFWMQYQRFALSLYESYVYQRHDGMCAQHLFEGGC